MNGVDRGCVAGCSVFAVARDQGEMPPSQVVVLDELGHIVSIWVPVRREQFLLIHRRRCVLLGPS